MYDKHYSFRMTDEVSGLVNKCVAKKTLGRTNADFLRTAVCLAAVILGEVELEDLSSDYALRIKRVFKDNETCNRIQGMLLQSESDLVNQELSDSTEEVIAKLNDLMFDLSGTMVDILDVQRCLSKRKGEQ